MLSKIDRDLSSRDNSLPGLSLILDPEYIQNRINSCLPDVKIQKVQNIFVNYKPSNKCLVLHNLITDSDSFQAYSQIYRSEHIEKEKKRLKDLVNKNYRISLGHRLTDMINSFDDNILTYFLPIDRRLKNISNLYNADPRNLLFKKRLPKNEELIDSEFISLNYKPEKRYVAKLCKNNTNLSVIKLYDSILYRQADLNADLYKKASAFNVPELQKRINKLNCLVYKWVEGKNLNSYLFNNNPDLDIIKNVGAALSDLNNQRIKYQLKFNKKLFVNKLISISQDVEYLQPSVSVKLSKIVNRVSELLLNVQGIYLPVHGDFNSSQVIVDNKQNHLCLLDFDHSCLGHPAYDLGNFMAHYINHSYKVGLDSSLINYIRESITEGYIYRSKIKLDNDVINIYTVACLIRLLTDPFRYRCENWDKSIYKLIEYISDETDKLKKKHSYIENNESSINIEDKYSVVSDNKMSYLKYSLDPEYMQSIFNIYYKDVAGSNIQLSGIEVSRYKKERRCLIEYKFNLRKDIELIGKTKASSSVKRNYKINKDIYSSGFDSSSSDKICMPKPLFYAPNINMWFQKKIQGKTCGELLTNEKGFETAKLIAESAYKIHKCDVSIDKYHTIDDEMQILTDRLGQVSTNKPILSKRIEQVLRASKTLASSIPKPTNCCIHRDFYHDQLIIKGDKVYILDFDLFCKGDPAVDIGNFIAHLTELSIRTKGSADGFIDIENEIEKHYLEISDLTNSYSIQAYKTLTLVRHIYISALFQDRCAFTEEIISLCEKKLLDF